jgi:hypothetical protein
MADRYQFKPETNVKAGNLNPRTESQREEKENFLKGGVSPEIQKCVPDANRLIDLA